MALVFSPILEPNRFPVACNSPYCAKSDHLNRPNCGCWTPEKIDRPAFCQGFKDVGFAVNRHAKEGYDCRGKCGPNVATIQEHFYRESRHSKRDKNGKTDLQCVGLACERA